MNAHRILMLALVSLLSSGCGQAFPPMPTVVAGHKSIPASSLFKGRLVVGHSGGVFALTSDAAKGAIQRTEIRVSGGNELAISPDQRFVLFSNERDGTGPIDVSTWAMIPLFPLHVHCLQWAADGRRFSLVGGPIPILYVFHLDPEALEVTSSDRVFISPAELYPAAGRSYAGDLDCGYWVGENRLLFKSYRGPLPPEITLPDTPELDVNTTTLALLGERTAISYFPWLLSVKDVSKDLAYILVELKGTLFIGKPFDNFDDIRLRTLRELSNLEVDPGQFTPDSREIILWSGDSINFVDIETLAVRSSFPFPAAWRDYGFRSLVEAEWVGDPHDGILIWNDPNGALRIGSLQTGLQAALWDTAASEVDSLLWLP